MVLVDYEDENIVIDWVQLDTNVSLAQTPKVYARSPRGGWLSAWNANSVSDVNGIKVYKWTSDILLPSEASIAIWTSVPNNGTIYSYRIEQ